MNAIKAAARYAAKLIPANVALDFTTALATMQSNYADSATDLFTLEGIIKGILNLDITPAPIPTTDFPGYYSFAKQLFRKMRRFPGGPQLANEATYLQTTYAARGFRVTALESIKATLLFGTP